jgi:hypothetical protein
VCLAFIFGALLEFALVNYAARKDMMLEHASGGGGGGGKTSLPRFSRAAPRRSRTMSAAPIPPSDQVADIEQYTNSSAMLMVNVGTQSIPICFHVYILRHHPFCMFPDSAITKVVNTTDRRVHATDAKLSSSIDYRTTTTIITITIRFVSTNATTISSVSTTTTTTIDSTSTTYASTSTASRLFNHIFS